MALTYTTNNLEYNGGGLGIWPIPAAQQVAGAYTGPVAYTDWVQLGATDGISLEYTTENTDVYCDQVFGMIDSPTMATMAVVTVTCEEMTVHNLAVAMGLDPDLTGSDIDTGKTDLSVIAEGAMGGNTRIYAGGPQQSTYFDLQFEKEMSHGTSNYIVGFRIPKCISTGDVTLAFKHGETDFYELKFTALAFDYTPAQDWQNELFYYIYQTS